MSLSRGRGLRRSPSPAAVVLASVVAIAALAIVAPHPAGAGSAGNPHLTLLDQTQWVAPSPTQPGGLATYTLEVSAPGAPAGAQVSVTVYGKLHSRSAFEATLRSSPAQVGRTPVAHTAVPLSQLQPGPDNGLELHMMVAASGSSTAGSSPSPSLDLTCAGTCTGVYPVVVALEGPSGSELDHFTTFLTYAARTTEKLRFAWVVPLTSRTSIRSGATDPVDALSPLPPRTATRLEHLIAQLRTGGVPVTLEPSAQTVQALAADHARGKAAVASLATMAADPSTDQVVTEGYVPIDLAALAGAGEPTEIRAQVTAARDVLGQQLKLGPGHAPGTTWIATDKVGPALGTGLAQVGATHVVVPDTQLAAVTGKSGTTKFTWASTFQLSLGGNQTVDAAASDGVLTSQFTPRGDPVLAATRLLADLAVVHSEEPFKQDRGLVAVPPTGWRPTARFDHTLLAGLRGNPVVQPVTLSRFFSSVASLETEPTRRLAASSGPALPRSLAHQISTARLRLTTFVGAISQTPPPPALTELSQALLVAEASYRTTQGMSAEVGAFDQLLSHQLSMVRLSSTDNSITLTARTGWIPITVVSNAPYTIRGVLTLSSSKFKFPEGATRDLTLAHPTNSVRVHVVARTLGDSPVTVKFTAPGGRVLASGQVTVRSTATSVVGVVLTAAALVILLGWWARTWWTGRRRRRTTAGAGRGA